MAPFWKTYTFWISACAWLVSMGGQYAELVPSPYGLVAGNAVAIVYAVMRCLQKRSAGIPWKGILFTSEFLVTGATVLINFLESLKNIPSLSPRVLAVVSASVVGLGSLLHTLGGSKLPPPPTFSAALRSIGEGEGSAVVASPASEAVTKVDKAEDVRSPAAYKPAAGDETLAVGKKPGGL